MKYTTSSSKADTKFKIPGWQLNNVGSTTTIPIEIVSMSLTSVQPIPVSFGSGGTSFFDVFVILDPQAIQQPGALTLTLTGQNTGTFQMNYPVSLIFTFSNTNPNGPQPNGPIRLQNSFTSSGQFAVVPEPTSILLIATGAAGIYLRKRARKKI
jgi:hypothetical protein